ncbi:ABC transporter permease [Clavibacter sp. VKM Ac-2872]|uniref:ABC transporter permease n=1 Tax=Clavibacter sp. VKM Ac-2872 TaxID=2783812 RepID=UPI001889CC35|nr:ABC transporter permease [Clavibacter sp. VKM Ac-2872]MBF4625793.1 FtsX-like permease family protein [Clavibacter sp. VKM Ac-2872]
MTVASLLPVVGVTFLIVALYVSAIVTANTCATVIAGRTRELALQRILGATGSGLRRQIIGGGFLAGIVGSIIGVGGCVLLSNVALMLAAQADVLPEVGFLVPTSLLPLAIAVVLITVGAFVVCSRVVLTVAPLQALTTTVEEDPGRTRSTGRLITSLVLFVGGSVGLVLAISVASAQYYALLIAVGAGVVSFTGVVVGTPLLIPALLRVMGRLFQGSPISMLAARNSVRSPRRAARTTVGLLIAIVLMVMFAVALATYSHMLQVQTEMHPETYRGTEETVAQVAAMITVLASVAGVIASIGVVNVTALTVRQRARELGLLRVLGATRQQVRAVIVIESSIMVMVATGVGLVLGIAYGWAGCYSLLGKTEGAVLAPPVIPIYVLVVVVIGAGLTALVSALGPAARAVRPSPVSALASE